MARAIGVRRSWDTAASRALRTRLPSSRLRARAAREARSRRSRTTARCPANDVRTRRSGAESRPPRRARTRGGLGGETSAVSSAASGSTGGSLPTWASGAQEPSLGSKQGHRGRGEGAPHEVEERGQVLVTAQHRAVQADERVRLAPRLGRLHGPARGLSHHGGDRDRDHEEEGQQHQVGGPVDAERATRRGEEPGQETGAEHGGRHRRPQPTDEGAQHGDGEEPHGLRGEGGRVGRGDQRRRQRDRAGQRQHPAGGLPSGAQHGTGCPWHRGPPRPTVAGHGPIVSSAGPDDVFSGPLVILTQA